MNQNNISLEKVIKGLEWLVVLFSNYERHAMGDEEMQSLNDALVLLKAQEPRVMTLEEIHSWDGSFFLESIGGTMVWASYFGEYDQCGETVCRIIDNDGEVDDRYKTMYKSRWRCWTSRPTDAQREATPWN